MTKAEIRRRKRLFKEASKLMASGRRTPVEQPWPDGDYTKAPFADSKLTETEALQLLRDKIMECVAAGVPMQGDPGGCVMLLDDELKDRRAKAKAAP